MGRTPRTSKKKTAPSVLLPACIATMPAHTEPVLCLEALSDLEFASTGADGNIILWRDGRILAMQRNRLAALSLIKNNSVGTDISKSF